MGDERKDAGGRARDTPPASRRGNRRWSRRVWRGGRRAWGQDRPLVVAWPNTPPKIDPPTINQIVEHELVANTYDRLFEFRSSKRADGTFLQTLQATGRG